MIRTVIVEDEKDGQDYLVKCLKKYSDEILVVGIEASVQEASETINQVKPDLVFMDIEIINGTGFDVLAGVSFKEFEIIFVTAFNQYAIKAIKENASDYILKPIIFQELKKGLDKVVGKIKKSQEQQFLNEKLCIPTLKGNEFVFLRDIIYFEASGNSTRVLTTQTVIMSTKLIGQYELQITSNQFFRCHNSFLVNLAFIQKLVQQRSGVLVMRNGDSVPVAQRKMKLFKNFVTYTN